VASMAEPASFPTTAPGDRVRPSRSHVWERWGPVWHALFVVGLSVPTLVAMVGPPSAGRAGTLALAVALGAAYLGLVLLPDRIRAHVWVRLAYFAAAITLFALLVRRDPAYTFLAFALYPQVFVWLELRWAIPTAVVLTAVFALAAVGSQHLTDTPVLLSFVGPAVVALMVALFVDAISSQSAGRQEMIEELESTRAALAGASRTAGVLEERQRLAREIHDTVAQDLASIVTQLEAAEQALPLGSHEARRHVESARASAREGLAEVRRSVHALRPAPLEDASLADAVGRVAGRWSSVTGVEVRTSVEGPVRTLPADVEVGLLRVAQEALTNVARHAEASSARVTLTYGPGSVALTVADDGVGMVDGRAGDSGSTQGFGLAGMRERIEGLGGVLTVAGEAGQGTTVHASVPVAAA
jgi:signal transduction histidine kinase